jgi:hypothetical protein
MEIRKKLAHHFYSVTIKGTSFVNKTALVTYFYYGFDEQIFYGFVDIDIYINDKIGTLFNTEKVENVENIENRGKKLIIQTLKEKLQLTSENEIQIFETVIAIDIEYFHQKQLVEKVFQRDRIGVGFDIFRYTNNDRQENLTSKQVFDYLDKVKQELIEKFK